jgi:hypothetical protein
MPCYLRSGLMFILIILFPINVCAMSSIKDADAVITMRDGKPCFSYPQDKEIQARPYSFGYLSVSNISSVGGDGWEIRVPISARKESIEPNSPSTCIKYGVLHPWIKSTRPAERLLMNTPYEVLIVVHSPPLGPVYNRKFLSEFCLVRDAKGNTVVVDAEWDDNARATKCLKPGESPRRSLWQKLFGR